MKRLRPIFLFSVILGTGLLLVATINMFYGGGSVLFLGASKLAELAEEQIQTDRVLVFREGFDDRSYKKEVLRLRASEIQTLVTGSSRVMFIDGRVLGVNEREFYNAAVSAGSLEDHIIMWQICKEAGARPKTVWVGLDSGLLNESLIINRWKAHSSEFQRFRYSVDGTTRPIMKFLVDWPVNQYWLKFVDLMSAVRLIQAGNRLFSIVMSGQIPQPGAGDMLGLVEETTTLTKGQEGYRSDGTLLNSKEYMLTRFKGDAAERAITKAKAGDVDFLRRWYGLSRERKDFVRLLLEDMKVHDVRVIGVTLPYAPGYWDALKSHAVYGQLLKEEGAFLGDVFARYQFEYYNLADPAILGLSTEDFHDATHLTPEGIAKTMKYIHAQGMIL